MLPLTSFTAIQINAMTRKVGNRSRVLVLLFIVFPHPKVTKLIQQEMAKNNLKYLYLCYENSIFLFLISITIISIKSTLYLQIGMFILKDDR